MLHALMRTRNNIMYLILNNWFSKDVSSVSHALMASFILFFMLNQKLNSYNVLDYFAYSDFSCLARPGQIVGSIFKHFFGK